MVTTSDQVAVALVGLEAVVAAAAEDLAETQRTIRGTARQVAAAAHAAEDAAQRVELLADAAFKLLMAVALGYLVGTLVRTVRDRWTAE